MNILFALAGNQNCGKTLGMSMMAEFFDIRKDSSVLFESLSVSKNEDLCKCWMNQHPTIFISFRNVDGDDFNDAYGMLEGTISNIFMNHVYLLESRVMHEVDKKVFLKIAERTASKSELKDSLLFLTHVMSRHYGKPVILLIDEYDVPLAKASAKGYYKEMFSTIRGVLSALKDNPALNFAIVTGCLQIIKESIFTGTTNDPRIPPTTATTIPAAPASFRLPRSTPSPRVLSCPPARAIP